MSITETGKATHYTQAQCIIAGGGSAVPSAGVKGIIGPFATDMYIEQATCLLNTAGTAQIDLWIGTVADYVAGSIVDADSITASAPVSVPTGLGSVDSTLTGWNRYLPAGYILVVYLDSATYASVIYLTLKFRRGIGDGVAPPLLTGIAGGYAPLDEDLTIPADYLPPNNFTRSTIGTTSLGGSSEANPTTPFTKTFYKRIAIPSDGFLMSVAQYIAGNATNVAVLASGVYEDAAGPVPGKLLAANQIGHAGSSQISGLFLSATPRWVTVPIGLWVPAGNYWIASMLSSTSASILSIYYNSGAGSDRTRLNSGPWLDDSSTSSGTNDYSIYANFVSG